MAAAAQQRVYLRIKRKRDDSSLENVVVERTHINKKQNVSVKDIGKELESTSLNHQSNHFVFRRIDTVDGDGQLQVLSVRLRHHSFRERRRVQFQPMA